MNLARDLVGQQWDVTVFTCDHRGTTRQGGIEVVGMGRHLEVGGAFSFPGLAAASDLAEQLRSRKTECVSVHTRFFPATWLGIWSGRRAGACTVLTEHGGGSVQTGSALTTMAARAIDSSLGRWALNSADSVLAVSDRAAENVERISGRKAQVYGNGIDLGFWTPAEWPSSQRRVIFVGRLVEEKGWRDFLRIVAAAGPDVDAYLVGDGPDRARVHGEIDRLGLGSRVVVTGRLSADGLKELYPGSVYVNPSTAAEGLQTTLLEAAAAGARIASFDVGGAHEVATAGGRILIVPSGSFAELAGAVGQLLGQQAAYPNGLHRYDWSEVAQRFQAEVRESCRRLHRSPEGR